MRAKAYMVLEKACKFGGMKQHTLTKHPGSLGRFLHTNYTGLTSWEQIITGGRREKKYNAVVLKSNSRIWGHFVTDKLSGTFQ